VQKNTLKDWLCPVTSSSLRVTTHNLTALTAQLYAFNYVLLGRYEPAPTSTPSAGCLLLLSCG
jgi:hypothetical protein